MVVRRSPFYLLHALPPSAYLTPSLSTPYTLLQSTLHPSFELCALAEYQQVVENGFCFCLLHTGVCMADRTVANTCRAV